MTAVEEQQRGSYVPAPTNFVRLPMLRAWRLHTLRRQGEVARAAGVSKATMIRAEKGWPVEELTAARLARALGVTVEQLESEKPS